MDPANQTNCVLILNLPPSALGGINLLSFTTTPKFHGVKNLPPGWHFVFAASDSFLSVRHGAWFYVHNSPGPPQIFIKKWVSSTEELVAENSQADLLRWRANLGRIWKDGLTPYRQSAHSSQSGGEGGVVEESTDWNQLTSHITPTLLTRITAGQSDHWSLTSTSSATEDIEDMLGLARGDSNIHPDKELHFLHVDLKKTWREGATGRERTEAAQDHSWALGELLEKHATSNDTKSREAEILGELQFCFLMILTLNNNSCLEQWKRLLSLLFTCRQAVRDRKTLYMQLFHVLKLQLSHCKDIEGGLFDLNDDGGGFLKPLLRRFRKSLDEFDGKWKSDVIDELDDLQDYLKQEFGWELDDSFLKRGMVELEDGERVELQLKGADEDDETGEYAPTVVELTPAQLRALEGVEAGGNADEDEEEDADLEDMDTRF